MSGEKLNLSTEDIIDKYADMVYRLAVNEMGNRDDAQDVFQEVFMRLVRYRERISTEEHLKAWLIRVTINCARKQQTAAWRKNVTYLEKEDGEHIPDEASEKPFSEVENTDSSVVSAVAGLPEKYRTIIYLFYYEEKSVSEIAALLSEKESTVKSKLHRAREMLKTKLKGEVT